MIKITQDSVSKNFVVTVVLSSIRETFKISSAVSRILAKQGVVSVSTSTKSGGFSIDFSSYNDETSIDNVIWLLTDNFNVGYGYWDNFGIFAETILKQGVVQTNKDGSCVKLTHKNAHKLRDDSEFPFTFAGGLQYFQCFKDTVRIDFPSSHINALQVAQDLQNLLDSLN